MPMWANGAMIGCGSLVLSREADQHEDERLVDLIVVGQPGALAVGVLAPVEQLSAA